MRVDGRLDLDVGVAANVADARAVEGGSVPTLRVFEPNAPVLSLGRRSVHVALDQQTAELARARGFAVRYDDRGGRATLHAPGQLVALLAWPMPKTQIPRLCDALLEALQRFAAQAGVRAELRGGEALGLWVGAHKLASLGLRHQRGVVRHGVAINVAVPAGLGAGLALCGMPTTGLASLHAPIGTSLSPEPLDLALAAALAHNLNDAIAAVADGQRA